MRHLLTPDGQLALAAAMALRPLLAFDFDGTLAPIVARPADAHVPVAVLRRLSRLAELLPVAIITGRRVDDVRKRLTFQPAFIIGNHGAEDPSEATPATDASVFAHFRDRLGAAVSDLQSAGVTVEDKQHSIALHYRLARDPASALKAIRRLVADLDDGLSAHDGKRVVNVVADAAPDKAHALAKLVQKCGAQSVVFVGDDLNDEPVFERAEPSWLTIRIGRDNPNTRAKYFLDTTAEVVTVLERMLVLWNRQFG